LGVGEVVVESTGVLQSDVTVEIGRDWEKQRKQALKSDFTPKSENSFDN
jgi:hypothetical protein